MKVQSLSQVLITAVSLAACAWANKPSKSTTAILSITTTTTAASSATPTGYYLRVVGKVGNGRYAGDYGNGYLEANPARTQVFTIEAGTNYLKLGNNYSQIYNDAPSDLVYFRPDLSSTTGLSPLACTVGSNKQLLCSSPQNTAGADTFKIFVEDADLMLWGNGSDTPHENGVVNVKLFVEPAGQSHHH